MQAIQDRMYEESDLEDIFDTILDHRPGYYPYQIETMQKRTEIKQLANLVKNQSPDSLIEIGTAKDGTFYLWCRYLETMEEAVSLDLPGGDFGRGYNERKIEFFEIFAPGINAIFIWEDSHKEETYNRVKEAISGEIDFLFIDGDHTYEGIKQDFETYRDLVSEGEMIALHDIVPQEKKSRVNVDEFWREVKDDNETEDLSPKTVNPGLGLV